MFIKIFSFLLLSLLLGCSNGQPHGELKTSHDSEINKQYWEKCRDCGCYIKLNCRDCQNVWRQKNGLPPLVAESCKNH